MPASFPLTGPLTLMIYTRPPVRQKAHVPAHWRTILARYYRSGEDQITPSVVTLCCIDDETWMAVDPVRVDRGGAQLFRGQERSSVPLEN